MRKTSFFEDKKIKKLTLEDASEMANQMAKNVCRPYVLFGFGIIDDEGVFWRVFFTPQPISEKKMLWLDQFAMTTDLCAYATISAHGLKNKRQRLASFLCRIIGK